MKTEKEIIEDARKSFQSGSSSGVVFKTNFTSLFIPLTHLLHIELVDDTLTFYFLNHTITITAPVEVLELAFYSRSSNGSISTFTAGKHVKITIKEADKN